MVENKSWTGKKNRIQKSGEKKAAEGKEEEHVDLNRVQKRKKSDYGMIWTKRKRSSGKQGTEKHVKLRMVKKKKGRKELSLCEIFYLRKHLKDKI